jgi:hypothetical protein
VEERVLRPSAVEIDKLVIAWTGLHTSLCNIFSLVVDQTLMGVAHAIWHSTTSDRAQRQMLSAALNRAMLPDANKRATTACNRSTRRGRHLAAEGN